MNKNFRKTSIATLMSMALLTVFSSQSIAAVGDPVHSGLEEEYGVLAIGIGNHATVQAGSGIAIGAMSEAVREAGVKNAYLAPGDSTDLAWVSTRGAVSVGSDTVSRQITGVAAGSADTDAVNVAQLKALKAEGDGTYAAKTSLNSYALKNDLNSYKTEVAQAYLAKSDAQNTYATAGDAANKQYVDSTARSLRNKINDVDKDLRAGVAMAMAVGNLPQAYMPGKSIVGVSAGTYHGQGGFALGLSHATDNRQWVFKGAASVDTRGNVGGTLSAGYQF